MIDKSRGVMVLCIDNEGEHDLTIGKHYRMIEDTSLAPGDCRIVDDSGEDYIHNRDNFVMPLSI